MIALADLEGVWRLDRQIEDRRAGLSGLLEGEAVWQPDGTGLTQIETGLLRYGDAAPMQATRRYLWREEAGLLRVYFDDGRPFHELTGAAPEARHVCPPDIYDVRYDLTGWPDWSARWHVTGPRKEAVITSRYRRRTGAVSVRGAG
ncbi:MULTISPECIES: DUF6314 family protein [Rhodophyticola]|uniref:DUF6314 family protein n=1 Tax=Rhodophyticola TaxID=2680018 RepID=UPI0035CFFD1A